MGKSPLRSARPSRRSHLRHQGRLKSSIEYRRCIAGVQREHTPPADGLDQEFPADDDASWGNPNPTCNSELGRFGLAREEMAMRDPSLVASKADIRQQAIKGGEAPQADIGHVCKLEDSVAKLSLRLRLDCDSVDEHCDSRGAVDDGGAGSAKRSRCVLLT